MSCGPDVNEMRAGQLFQSGSLNIHYSGQPPMSVLGPVTGSAYKFSPVKPVQPVDLRDARFLLASPLFKLAR